MTQQTFTKLSAAIREGAKIRPKAEGAYFREGWDHQLQVCCRSSCAMGAAWEAITGKEEVDDFEDLDAYFSRYFHLDEEINEDNTSFYGPIIPRPDGGYSSLFATITHMNDHMDMTREAIADYLERLGY